MTPGSHMEIHCMKTHWIIDNEETTQIEFHQYMRQALTCPDFRLADRERTTAIPSTHHLDARER